MSLNIALAMPSHTAQAVFPPRILEPLEPALTLLGREPIQNFTSPAGRSMLAQVDILLTGWGCPPIDDEVLDAAPRLRYVLHAAGSVKHHIGTACWERGIHVSSAADANAIPVAEYTVAMIILANKHVLHISRALHTSRTQVFAEQLFPAMGNYRKRVGIIGASKIGRHVIRLLSSYDLDVVVADPFLSAEEAAVLGVELVSLDELVTGCDVVSLHAPSLPSTKNLMDAAQIERMRPGSTFINTSRGELVDQDALLERVERGDLYAILDVTTPWVLPAESRLYTHPNVLLTPHIAGSLGNELERMASSAVGEALRLSRGEKLRFPVLERDLEFTA